MARFIDSIPPDFLANLSTEKFVKVLDILHVDKANEIDKFNRLFNHKLNTSTAFLVKFVEEITGWTLPPGMPKEILENILYNAEDLFEFKGTLRGLDLLFRVMTHGDVLINVNNFTPVVDYIIPSSLTLGVLPTSVEIAQLSVGGSFLYLYEDNISSTGGSIDIRVISKYSHVSVLKVFLEELVLEFIPFADATSLDINLYYYNYTPLSNSGGKNFTYGY